MEIYNSDFLSAFEKYHHLKELHVVTFVSIPKNSKCLFEM